MNTTQPPENPEPGPLLGLGSSAVLGPSVPQPESAADEVARLVDKCNRYIVDNARLAEEVQRLRLLTFCGCGDQFTAHDPGTCGACVAGMTCNPGA
jgi:hypothetical protein